MKKYYIYIVITLLLMVINACSSDTKVDDFDIPPHIVDSKKPEGAIRLMAYNIAVFNRDPNSPLNYQTIANMVNEKDVDVVCLNELDSCTSRTAKDYQY